MTLLRALYRNLLCVNALSILVLLAAAGAWSIFRIWWLPQAGQIVSDSRGYLEFADFRPHGYSALLSVHSSLFGGLKFLAHVQAALFFAAVLFLALQVGLRIGSVLGSYVVFFGTCWFPDLQFQLVMSDVFYGALLAAGFGFFVRFTRTEHIGDGVLASAFFGYAAIVRTIGFVPLAVFIVIAVLFSRAARGGSLRRGALLLVLPATFMLAGAASNAVHNGRFAIGSWGGVSLLGKALPLATPLPSSHHLSHLNWAAEGGREAQDAIAAADDVRLKMLLSRQYAEQLRWFHFWPRARQEWPDWRRAEERPPKPGELPVEYTSEAQGRLAGEVAWAFIGRNPGGYVRQTALDYASLWLLPRFMTNNEFRALSRAYDMVPGAERVRTFARTDLGSIDYFKVVPPPLRTREVFLARIFSAAFLLASLAFIARILFHGLAVVRRNPDLVLSFAAVHVTYAVTALVEIGLERYAFGVWPLLVAGTVLTSGAAARRVKAAVTARGSTEASGEAERGASPGTRRR